MSAESLDDAIHLFESIREIVGEDDEQIRIPGEALLKKLPPELRGPNWNAAAPAAFSLRLEAQPLLEKLQIGKVSYPASELKDFLPEGLINDDDTTLLELDLATVYAAVPPRLIEISSRISEVMEQILALPDYFKAGSGSPAGETSESETAAQAEMPLIEETPMRASGPEEETLTATAPPAFEQSSAEERVDTIAQEPVSPAPAVTEIPVEAPAAPAVSEPVTGREQTEAGQAFKVETEAAMSQSASDQPGQKQVLKPARHTPRFAAAWDGRERETASVAPIDLNKASLGEMVAIPGLGPKQAAAVIRYRELHGGLDSIYDLLSIPGIGAASFRKMTGLDPDQREDRSMALSGMLGLPATRAPRMSEICAAITRNFKLQNCFLGAEDGILISSGPGAHSEQAAECAALAPKIFRGTKKYLQHMGASRPYMFALPAAEPPLLFVGLRHLYMILALAPEENVNAMTDAVGSLARELDWLFSRRAMIEK